MLFANRAVAGRQLAHKLTRYANRHDVVVLAVPRGGVPVAFEIAEELDAPLDVFVVRKIGLPGQEEVAIGAVASGDILVLNEDLITRLDVPRPLIDRLAADEREELTRREKIYRGKRPLTNIEGRIAIVVDDGLATGASMAAAVRGLRRLMPQRLVVAVPVAAADSLAAVSRDADEIIFVATPDPFNAVSLWYDHFDQTTDDEVCRLLQASERRAMAALVN